MIVCYNTVNHVIKERRDISYAKLDNASGVFLQWGNYNQFSYASDTRLRR